MKLITAQNYSPEVNSSIGGKGRELFKLKELGVSVPSHAVTHVDEYFYFQKNKSFSNEFRRELEIFLAGWGSNTYFAVRSSMMGEDGTDSSFAGLFETYLYVRKENVLEKIKDCYQSINSPRVKQYLEQKNNQQPILGSVVIQEMIPSSVSGVAFSRSPVGENSHILIESSFGLGEGVVSGTVGVDTYRLNRFGSVVEKIITTKTERVTAIDGVVQMVKNKESIVKASSLEIKQLNELLKKIKLIEIAYQHPVDIEFAFVGEQLYFLQVRPITESFASLNIMQIQILVKVTQGRFLPSLEA